MATSTAKIARTPGQAGGRKRDPEHRDGAIRGLVGILGKRGSGKSYLLGKLAATCARILVFDTVCQFDLRGFDVITQPRSLADYLRPRLRRSFRAIYRPEHRPEIHFHHAAALVAAAGDMVFAVDEIDYFGTASACDEQLDWLVRYGRHRRVAMAYTARRPAECNRNLTAQTCEFRIFRLTEPRDIEYMSRLVGAAARQLPGLAQFAHLRYLDSGEAEIIASSGKVARRFSE